MMASAPGGSMTCREATLALMLGTDADAVARAERHRSTCSQCGVTELHSVPDRVRDALPEPPQWIIGLLLIFAGLQGFIAVPWLVGADPFGLLGASVPQTHTVRDGAVGIAITAAALLSAVQPRWARPAFLLSATVLVAQVVAGLIDSSISYTGTPELIHLVSVGLVILIGVCHLTQVATPLGPTRRQLRSIDPDE
jgi:hypothetical protein